MPDAPNVRCLVPAGTPTAAGLTLAGRRWVLVDDVGVGQYTCVSYACGAQQAPHPNEPRTVPARELQMRAGAVALLIRREDGVHRCVGTGVFVGVVPKQGEVIDIT